VKSQKVDFQWEGGAYGKLVEAAIKKNEEKLVGRKSTITPEWTRFVLNILDQNIKYWRADFRRRPLYRPREQSKIIERINRNAKDLLRDINALGLPKYSLAYFADEVVAARHADLFRPSDIEWDVKAIELKEYLKYFNWGEDLPISKDRRDALLKMLTDEGIDEQLKEYMEFFAWNLPISEVRIDFLLKKLTDKERLHEIANKPLLKKTNIDQPEVTHIIRRLAIFFQKRYGKKLPTTIEYICAAIYPNAKIDNDKVRNKLRNLNLT